MKKLILVIILVWFCNKYYKYPTQEELVKAIPDEPIYIEPTENMDKYIHKPDTSKIIPYKPIQVEINK